MGLGKTVVATKAAYDIAARNILIICPKNAIRVWEDHICQWFDGLDGVNGKETSFNIHRVRSKYNNADKRRKILSDWDRASQVNIYIVTAGTFRQDVEILAKHNYDCIIVDEAKRLGLTNRKSKLFETLKPLALNAQYFWPLTGTPGRLPQHFWSILHLIDHKYFSSYWKLIDAFCYSQKDRWGGVEVLGLRNADNWYSTLNRYSTGVSKQEIGHEPTQRQALWVDMQTDQRGLYEDLARDMLAVGPSELVVVRNSLEQNLRLRQLLCCPKILDPQLGIGGAFEDLVEQLQEIATPPVIFTPFKEAIPHFHAYLKENGYADTYEIGTHQTPDEMQDIIERWRRSKGIIFCSILFATSFSLEPADKCFFIGREFNPDDNAQAEERLNRLTTNYPVNSYYYAYEGTYDERHFEILDTKQRQEQKTVKNLT